MQRVLSKVVFAKKMCSPHYSFQSTSKDRQRDQLIYCPRDTSRKGSPWEEHTRENPANTEQPGPGRNRNHGRVCTKPPLSSLPFVLISLGFWSSASWDSDCLCYVSGTGPEMANSAQAPGLSRHHLPASHHLQMSR